MSEKIVLIDGHSILNRAFYGIPLLSNGEGLHTNAVYGFLNILFKVLEEEQAQYLAVAFDLHAPTFRHKMYEDYKGTRHAMPEELREQVPLMKEMLGAMQVPLMMLEGYEADDLLGTVSREMEEKGLQVRIISGDRDLLQLASDRTMIRIPKTKKSGTEVEDYLASDVKERYLVTPEEFIDVKALMGDASDNIPGIPGVGEKTAVRIIEQYHSIENAYAHIDEIRPAKAQNSLREHWDDAVLSKTLATIDRHAKLEDGSPFTISLEDARLGEDNEKLFTPEALEMAKRLELRAMISKFSERIAKADEEPREKKEQPFRLVELNGEQDFAYFLKKAGKCEEIGLQLLAENGRLLGAAVSFADETALLAGISQGQLQLLAAAARKIDTAGLKEQLIFLDDGSEFPEEQQEKYFDAEIGAYLLNPLSGEYTYDNIAKDFASGMVPSRAELLGKKTLSEVWSLAFGEFPGESGRTRRTKDSGGPSDEAGAREALLSYACLQAETALKSRGKMRERLSEEGMLELFDTVEMPLVFVLYHMEKEGILVRGEELRAYGEKLTGRISELEKEIWTLAGRTFNINSPKQLGTVLFEDLKLPGGKKTKTGYSTAADVLEKLAETAPIVDQILEYRQLTKLKSTYADGLSAFISEDGRIHGKFNQTVTATGRISSADPNLQNIPVRTELGRELRRVFVPKEGSVFIDADYSQIELRVLAHVSGDENLIEAYHSAEDIHAITASQVFRVPLEEVTPQLRRNAKAVNFGIVYGISSFGLSQGLSITRQEAAEYIEQYFKTYPGIKAYLDGCVQSAKTLGYSTTMLGRRRPIPELKESNFMRRSFGERVAMNAPIQGTAADIIKIAMIGTDRILRKEGLRSRLILQVHDELLVETAKGEEERVKQILSEQMTGAAKMRVNLEIDMHEGGSWYEAH